MSFRRADGALPTLEDLMVSFNFAKEMFQAAGKEVITPWEKLSGKIPVTVEENTSVYSFLFKPVK